MQNDDGGWAAFDRNNTRQFLCYVPFADHNAMIDPSTPDVTGRVLEALGKFGFRVGHPVVDRAVACLRRTQSPTGVGSAAGASTIFTAPGRPWSGWPSVGVPKDDPAMVAGADWLCHVPAARAAAGAKRPNLRRSAAPRPRPAHRLADRLGRDGPAGRRAGEPPGRHRAASDFLVDRQQTDGTWDEPSSPARAFPRVFYLRYHYYPIYFPLMALSRFAATASMSLVQTAQPSLRLVAADEDEPPLRAAASGQ